MQKRQSRRVVLKIEDLHRKYLEEPDTIWRLEAELVQHGVFPVGDNSPKGLYAIDIEDPPGKSIEEVLQIFQEFGCEAHPIQPKGE